MKRNTTEISLPPHFTDSLVHAAAEFPSAMVLNSNAGNGLPDDPYGQFDFLAGLGVAEEVRGGDNSFGRLQELLRGDDWVFAAFPYDLKNQVERLTSSHNDCTGFPSCHFFRPLHVVAVPRGSDRIYIQSLDGHSAASLADSLLRPPPSPSEATRKPEIQSRMTRAEYLARVKAIKKHLRRGDIYEMNFCMEFFAEDASLNAPSTYLRLNTLSPMPFSCYFKMDDFHLLCASPERFLQKCGNTVISQPIKGTAPRGSDDGEDSALRSKLENDEKERAENIMIVDLVRNDLSRTAVRGSVHVEELAGVHTFPALHQLISTVVSETAPGIDVTSIIRKAFPMGSMTGAPKVRAMQLIEEYESARRGLFSGAVGYFSPGGDFDLNVVIRSILYRENKYLSYQAGSAITIGSNAEKEYEECLLKARTMMHAIGHD